MTGPLLTPIESRPTSSRIPREERELRLKNPGFGKFFTDHMVTARWTREEGWHDAGLVPYGPLSLDPAAMVLHYGQAVFEGLKVYRQPDGKPACFRPYANAERFRHSARRLSMPELPEELFTAAVEALVAEDGAWVPSEGEASLYLRPLMFAVEPGLGVRPAEEYRFLLIASPAGNYFEHGVRPVSAWVSQDFVRAVPGGTGAAKCAGNYAASFSAQMQGKENGCEQVIWLDGVERRFVEEMGAMNLFFVHGSGDAARLVTPALSGALLPGIVRDSLRRLAADLGYPCTEESVSLDDWRAGCADGSLTEAFACGTAAVVTPVGEVRTAGGSWQVGDGEPGQVTMRLRRALTGIQFGTAPDPYGWMHPLPTAAR